MVLHLCRNGVFFSDCCRSLDLSLFFFSSVPSLPLLRFFFIFFSVFSLHLQHSEHRRNPISNIHQVRHLKHQIKNFGDKIQNWCLVEQIDAFLIFLRLLCYLHPSSSTATPTTAVTPTPPMHAIVCRLLLYLLGHRSDDSGRHYGRCDRRG